MIIEFEGSKIVCEDDTIYTTGILPGETYIACNRCKDWTLLTCKFTSRGANFCAEGNEKHFCQHHPDDGHIDTVFPVENAYAFNSWDSFKVLEIL